jgi:hypothetical protein
MYNFNELTPYIEIVDKENLNPTDHKKVYFQIKDDPVTVIKWCRRNFGARGDGWDFYGVGRKCTVVIWSSKLITMWYLWQD